MRTARIIGAAIEVHKILGPGFLEAVYKKAMEYELRTSGLLVEREKEILVPYKDIQITGQRLDLLVEAGSSWNSRPSNRWRPSMKPS